MQKRRWPMFTTLAVVIVVIAGVGLFSWNKSVDPNLRSSAKSAVDVC